MTKTSEPLFERTYVVQRRTIFERREGVDITASLVPKDSRASFPRIMEGVDITLPESSAPAIGEELILTLRRAGS